MLTVILFVSVFLLALYLSIGMRASRIAEARERRLTEEQTSPLAQAIKDFVAVAGGVYLGLMALAEFLKVPVPAKAQIWGTTFDPIAVFAVALAIIAPLFPGSRLRL